MKVYEVFFWFLTPKLIEMQNWDRLLLQTKLLECIKFACILNNYFFSRNLVSLLDENDKYINQIFNIENFFTDSS